MRRNHVLNENGKAIGYVYKARSFWHSVSWATGKLLSLGPFANEMDAIADVRNCYLRSEKEIENA